MEERMLSTEELAAMFRVCSRTAQRWARRYPKQLGPVKVVRAYRWPESKARAALSGGLTDEGEK